MGKLYLCRSSLLLKKPSLTLWSFSSRCFITFSYFDPDVCVFDVDSEILSDPSWSPCAALQVDKKIWVTLIIYQHHSSKLLHILNAALPAGLCFVLLLAALLWLDLALLLQLSHTRSSPSTDLHLMDTNIYDYLFICSTFLFKEYIF